MTNYIFGHIIDVWLVGDGVLKAVVYGEPFLRRCFMKTKRWLKIIAAGMSAAMFCLFFGCGGNTGSRYPYYYDGESYRYTEDGNYRYDEIIENDFSLAAENNESTFSLDRNTASYSLMRAQINDGLKIAENSVRIEEYVNYFDYDYKKPTNGDALAISGTLIDCPWNGENKLLTLGIAAEELDFSAEKQNNLVFLLDVSGSMDMPDRLPLVQQAFAMLTQNLNDNDFVSIVTYASGTEIRADGLRGNEKVRISNILQDITAGGYTAGASGINLAYKTAEKYFIKGGNNRVILATDGDFNVGISNTDDLKKFISERRDKGIYLSVMGFGMGNTRDDVMETLANSGNGNYGYIDTITEARKMLVEEMGGTFNVVAKDAKINVAFDKENVEKFRLIGYENKMISKEEFEDEKTDAGEIGSGHTVTAVYEIKLKNGASGEVAQAEIRYKKPGETAEKDIFASVKESFSTDIYSSQPTADAAFIACVTEYGLLLRNSAYKGNASFSSVIARLKENKTVHTEQSAGEDEKALVNPFRAEFLQIAEKAANLYESKKSQSEKA